MRRDFALGYLIGLIVGEGSFTGHGKANPAIAVKLHEDDPEPLLALMRAFGGELHGPYSYRGKDGTVRRSRTWYLRGKKMAAALPVFEKHLPASRKKEQFHVWLNEHGFGRQAEMFHVPHSKKSRVPLALVRRAGKADRQEALL